LVADSWVEVRVLLVSNTAMFAASEAFPASTMYVVAAVGPVVGTPCHDTVISDGIDELPCPVTDAATLAGTAGAPAHVVPCANAMVVPSGKQIHPIKTATGRILRTWGNKVIATLR
jgi:hypothetical protein